MKHFIRYAIFLLTASIAFAQGNSKLARDLEGLHPGAKVDVIVQFNHAPDNDDFGVVKARGGKFKKGVPLVKGGLFSVPAAALKGLAKNPAIRFISPDREVNAALDYARPAIGADIAQQYGWDGAGVTVAIIDTDIDSDEADLEDADGHVRVLYQESFVPGVGPEEKDNSHATHVAGIVVGTGKRSTGDKYTATYKGVAPGADLVHLRVLDKYGQGQDSWVIAAIERAIELKDEHNIRVINLSLGRPVFESHEDDPLCQAVKAAWEAGIVVVAAAGNMGRDNSFENQGYGTVMSPGNSPYVITVGAMKTRTTPNRSDDHIASYSSKGPTVIDHIVKPDLVAPGNRISSVRDGGYLTTTYPENNVHYSEYTEPGYTSGKRYNQKLWMRA